MILMWVVAYGFFFQAEDGIRDLTVTGVQTCALPISEGEIAMHHGRNSEGADRGQLNVVASLHVGNQSGIARLEPAPDRFQGIGPGPEIGRASCRERV